MFEIYEQDLAEGDLPVPHVHVPNWFFGWQGPAGAVVLTGVPFVFNELQKRGFMKDNETALPWLVVLLMMAWASVVIAQTGPWIKRQFLRRGRPGRRVIGGICFIVVCAFAVALFVVFEAVRNMRVEQKAEERAAAAPAPPTTPGGTESPGGDAAKAGDQLNVNLGDPYVQQRRAERAENDARDERARRQELQIQQLQRQVATLTARPATSSPGITAQPRGAAQPTGASTPLAAPPVGQFVVDLAPATGSCATIGMSTYLGRDGSETNLLNNAGPVEDEFKGYVDRIVAGANAKEPESEGRARDRLNSWMSGRVNEIEGAFGGTAALDFQRTQESDELVDKYRGVPFSNGSIEAMRKAAGYLACWRTILGNIRERRAGK